MNATKNRIVGRITGARTMAVATWLVAASTAFTDEGSLCIVNTKTSAAV